MSRAAAGAIAFFTSGAILVLEVLAGRLLAPYVGVTLQTYTAIIGVVLAGISLGTWIGGRLADRYRPRSLVGPILALGGVLALVSVPLIRTFAVNVDGGRVWVVIGLTAVGFFAPAAVLSCITPLLTKMSLSSLGMTGRTVGAISALSTAGAIVGTFVTGFLLVATISTTVIIGAVGAALVAVGLVLSWNGRRTRHSALALLVAGSAAIGANFIRSSPCQVETAYFCATVLHDTARATGRILRLDNLEHSYVDLADPKHLEFGYTQLFASAIDDLPVGPLHVVHLGGGGFTMPRYVRAVRPGSSSIVLERDVELPKLVQRRLGFVAGPDVTVRAGDGRVLIRGLASHSADVLFGDAFGAEAVPWHLTTVEFTHDIKRVLRDHGLYVLNAIDSPPSRFVQAELRTISAVFANVVVMAPRYAIDEKFGANFVIVASDAPINQDALRARIALRGTDAVVVGGRVLTATDPSGRAYRLPRELGRFAGARSGSAVLTLTDDFAPVDQLFTPG